MDRGERVLKGAVGEWLQTITVKSESSDEAVFLSQNISKLSPLSVI